MVWRRTTQRLMESGELIRPVAESLPLQNAITLYKRQDAPQRTGSEAFLCRAQGARQTAENILD